MRHALLAALLGAAVLAGCGDSAPKAAAPTTATAPTTTSISIKKFLYSPTPATVKAGTKVSIVNADAAAHTLTDKADTRAFESGTIKGGTTGSVTFSKPGTYSYFCEFHPYMKGSITVTG